MPGIAVPNTVSRGPSKALATLLAPSISVAPLQIGRPGQRRNFVDKTRILEYLFLQKKTQARRRSGREKG
jgi:hypothetical protein